MHSPGLSWRDVNPAPSKHQQRIPVASLAQAAKRVECGAISIVRCRREKNDIRSARGQRRDRSMAVAVGRNPVSFVDNNHVPVTLEKRG